ncbi:dystrobrevin beta [Phlebotomus papatasi]|uniref:dystrobrevin beta n=1 Tax=Phlebotomus papatasi TaxID=29031 RepID=UPI0024833A56|nr:dystrobrevin beta [Phlebotomus papatasi]
MFERKETENGYIIYVNTRNNQQVLQVDPKLQDVLNFLNGSYITRHYKYRCAARLSAIRKRLFTSKIPFHVVLSILERHQLGQIVDDAPVIKPGQLTSVLHDIFYANDKLKCFAEEKGFDVEEATGLLANFLWNIFDPNRCRSLSGLELREALLLLCDTNSFEDFIKHHFILSSDHNRCVPHHKFKSLLMVLTRILNYIDREICCDDKTISAIVQESFSAAECPGIAGLNEYQFYKIWTTDDIQFHHYVDLLATMRRIEAFNNFVHPYKCSSCLSQEITGLRFKCHRCVRFQLCLECFLKDFQNKRHQPVHKMSEAEAEEKMSKRFGILMLKMCHLFDGPSQSDHETSSREISKPLEQSTRRSSQHFSQNFTIRSKSGTFRLRKPQFTANDQLFGIIQLLTSENSLFQSKLSEIQTTCDPKSDFYTYLESHKNIITEQIDQLRSIWKQSLINQRPHYSSTPHRPALMDVNWRKVEVEEDMQPMQPMERTIRGVDINRTYFDANRSDYSVKDVSSWIQNRKSLHQEDVDVLDMSVLETQMVNFRELLSKVKEIVEDSYSDNIQLSKATHQLEYVLDRIIGEAEEQKKHNP